MIKSGKFLRLGLAGVFLASSGAFAQQLVLAPENTLTTGQYGDFKVQSLELNEKCLDAGNPLCIPSGPYPVQSSPGQIADYLLILQGGSTANNYPPLTTATGDNAFVPPQGGSDGSNPTTGQFQMTAANEPTPTFTGDRSGSWEVQLGTLLEYLTQDSTGQVADLVFLFDNNQQGAGFDQFQAIFATASIRDESGAIQGGQCYGLFGAGGYGPGGTCDSPNPQGITYDASGAPTDFGDYVQLTTDFCVQGSAPYGSYNLGTAKNQGDCLDGDYFVSNNLGNNSAEFAAYNSSLQDFFVANALLHPEWVLSVDIRLANLTDGPEQAWICSACGLNRKIEVPEPASLALVGLALLGVGLSRRRRA